MLGQFRKVLEKEEVPPRMPGSMFYQAAVASVLLYSSESWMVSLGVMCELEGFTWRPTGGSRACALKRSKRSGFIHTPLMFWRQRTCNSLSMPWFPTLFILVWAGEIEEPEPKTIGLW